MVKTLTIKEETNEVVLAGGESLVQVDSSILESGRIPFIRLLQKNSDAIDNGEKPATFYNDLLMYNYGETISVIPLSVKEGAFYIKKNERKLTCRSGDGVTNMAGEACRQCPHGVYHRGPWVNNKSPDCHTTINLFCVETETGHPGVIVFKVKSLKEGEKIGKQLAFVNKPIGITLGSDQEKNDSGIFYIPKARKLFPLTQEQYEVQKHWINKMRGKVLNTVDENVEDVSNSF